MIPDWEEVLTRTNELEAERIILRRFALEDAEAVLEYASDEQTVEYLVWDGIKTIGEAQEAISGYYTENHGVFAISLKENGKCIGCIDLRPIPEHDKASFGYVLNRKYWNNGYMTEALKTLLQFAFQTLGVNRVESTHYIGNEGSGRVMEKCGMIREGVFRQELRIKGVFRDVAHYGVLRDEADCGNRRIFFQR